MQPTVQMDPWMSCLLMQCKTRWQVHGLGQVAVERWPESYLGFSRLAMAIRTKRHLMFYGFTSLLPPQSVTGPCLGRMNVAGRRDGSN